MKKSIRNFILICILTCAAIFPFSEEKAWAAGEKVYFGSESYEWELGQTWLLGTYAGADNRLDSVDYIVTYDPEMLDFELGGELLEPGKVQVSASEIEGAEFKRLMNFTPRMSGNTEIVIEEAKVTAAGGDAAEAMSVSVPIRIAIPAGCRLQGITVNGSEISGFDPEVTDYTVDLDTYMEQADITFLPDTAQAEISDTKLFAGENEIYIVTTDDEGQKARYTVHINCPEEVVPVVEETDQEPEEIVPEDTQKDGEKSFLEFVSKCLQYAKDIAGHHKVLTVILSLLILDFIVLLVLKRYAKVQRKRAERERKLRKQKLINEAINEEKNEGISEEQPYEEDSVCIEVEESRLGGALLQAEKITDPAMNHPVNAAKKEMVQEIKMVTREDLAAASDYLEEDEVEIEVDHVTMKFKREKDESSSIKELVIRTLKRQRSYEYFTALDDVSFTVNKGEVVGIIGTNGSGKSTILKIISGVLAPTDGSVSVDHRKVQLLTLGTGFDFELTGRENVYLNGAIIGYTKEYIDEKYDEIVKFAELEGFMEEKVRNYSSGMVSRLGFAIATARDTPGILILDEVLSVGDMFFRKKSEKRIREMIHSGSTVLIVSHSTGVIRANCTKVVWIEKGKMKAVGDPKEVCAAYERMNG